MIYLTISKGYEPGGLRHEPVIFDSQGKPSLSTYTKEEAIQTEIGIKGTFMDGRGNFSAAAFMIDYEDRLFTTIVQSATGPFESIGNSGNSENVGFELELAFQATENLSLAAAFGTLNAEWDAGTIINGVDMSGRTPSGSIDNGASLEINYEKPLNNGLEFMRSELDANIPEIFIENFTVSSTGGHVLTSVTVNEIQKTQITSTLIAIVFAAITLVFIYRSLDLGIIAVLPTILASVWILATMTLLGITLNVLTVMVTALTIGLGIDYAIHIVERYREEREHKTESQAIETTIVRTGSALLISGLTTVSGFAVLFLSPMPLVRNFGIITAATIIYSMFIAIFVLPSLIWISNRIKEWISSQTLD